MNPLGWFYFFSGCGLASFRRRLGSLIRFHFVCRLGLSASRYFVVQLL